MKELVIIGAGGFGRVVYSLAERCKNNGDRIIIKGFLDANPHALDNYNGYAPILGDVDEYTPSLNEVFVCAIGNKVHKKRCIEIILSKGGEFINLIDPTVYIGKNVLIGKGCIINQEVHIGQDVHIGSFVTFDGRANVSHDDVIGDFCHIGATAFVAGAVKIGNNVTIHPGAYIIPQKMIGDNAIIGVGSVVISNVKSNTTVFGNPAKKVDF